MAVADAIKELFKEELQNLVDKQTEQGLTVEKLTQALQDLSGKVLEREQEAAQLRDSFTSYKQEIEESNGKFQALVNEDVASLKARTDRLEDDADGPGGMKQVHASIEKLKQTMSDVESKNDDSCRLVRESTMRLEEFDRRLRELARQCEDVVAKVAKSQTEAKSVENITAAVEKSQQALEDTVGKKYEKLWEDVLHAIEEMKVGELEAMQRQLQEQYGNAKAETRSMVNYALNFMATAKGDQRQMAINKHLVTAWKEQTWISARRRMGISKLHTLMLKQQRCAFNRFVVTTVTDAKTAALCDRLRDQYDSQLSEVAKKSQDGDDALDSSIKQLKDEVGSLRKEKCSEERHEEDLTKLRTDLKKETQAIPPLSSKLDEHAKNIAQMQEEHRAHNKAEASLGTQVAEVTSGLQDFKELASTFAKSDEVNNMIRDILMIWNSLKSLDATKADRDYVDNFALHSKDKEKLSSRRFEDLEADLAAKSRQDALRVEEKVADVGSRVDENVRNIRHWEQMWEKLSGLVEDLVTKINDLQGQAADNGKLPDTLRYQKMPCHGGGTNYRMGSRAQSRDQIPVMPTTIAPSPSNGLISSDATTPKNDVAENPQVSNNYQTLWINSARGVVDATIDQAIQPLSSRKVARPKSATTRRQYDRAK